MRIGLVVITLGIWIISACSSQKDDRQVDNSNYLDSASASVPIIPTDSVGTEYSEPMIPPDSVAELKEYHLWYKNVLEPVVFSENAYVYSEPDTASEIIDSLSFNSPFIPVEHSQITEWVEIRYAQDTAYLKTRDVVFYTFPSYRNSQTMYFITESLHKALLLKYHTGKNQFTDTFDLEYFIPDRAVFYNSSLWENTDLLILLNHNENCGGCPDEQMYIIDANDRFEILFRTAQFIDDGEESAGSESSVFLPENPSQEDIIFTESQYGYEEGNKSLSRRYKWDGEKLVELSVEN